MINFYPERKIDMLKERTAYTSDAADMHTAVAQCIQEGKSVSNELIERARYIAGMDRDDIKREKMASALLDELDALPVEAGYPYNEPSGLQDIKAARPGASSGARPEANHGASPEKSSEVSPEAGPGEGAMPSLGEFKFDKAKAYDKIYGAWLGRCAGCLLGQPVEGWTRERIDGLLKATGSYPLRYYISSDISEDIKAKYGVADKVSGAINSTINWINNVKHAPEDDDTNYTILGLKILEDYGPDFTPEDVAESWLLNLPILHVCTAEMVAYKNLVNRIWPPFSGSTRNPYREFIGAQIRADFFGYVNPGNPELAAEMGWRDASISHVKNGIYGEMFVAAMLAAAAAVDDPEEIIRCGLSQIPEKCRLAEKVRLVMEWKRKGKTWQEAIADIHREYDEKLSIHLTHTITNAMLVCIGLLYGETDLGKSICIAVEGAFDTDCNGATVGSIVGMIRGAGALPEKWIKPFNDTLKSGVDGFGMVKISELAGRTLKIAENIRNAGLSPRERRNGVKYD